MTVEVRKHRWVEALSGRTNEKIVAAVLGYVERQIIAQVHRTNPGTDRDDELEILAAEVFGWIY